MGEEPVHLIEVTPRELPGLQDTRGESIRSMLSADHNLAVGKIRSITGYQVKANLSSGELLQSLQDLFTDPIIEEIPTQVTPISHKVCAVSLPGAAEIIADKGG